MSALALLRDLEGAGLEVKAEGDKVVVRPAGALSEAHRASIRAEKAGLLALLRRPARPFMLGQAEAEEAHASPWGEAAIARFLGREERIRRRGFGGQSAEDLAERLHLRDVQADHRALCLECCHLGGTAATSWRCGGHRSAQMGRELPADVVTKLQACPGFMPAALESA
jgi:hypothetical protein